MVTLGKARWCILVPEAPMKMRQENCEAKASLGYIMRWLWKCGGQGVWLWIPPVSGWELSSAGGHAPHPQAGTYGTKTKEHNSCWV